MKRKYTTLKTYNKNEINSITLKTDDNKKTKQINENYFYNEETMDFGKMQIVLQYITNSVGVARGVIGNNCLDYFDPAELYNQLGPIAYKQDVLRRYKELLEKRKAKNEEIVTSFAR